MQRQQNSAHALGARGNAENEEKKAAFFSQLPPFSLASFRLPFFFVLPVFDRQLVPGLDGRLFNWPVGWSVVQLVIFFSVGRLDGKSVSRLFDWPIALWDKTRSF